MACALRTIIACGLVLGVIDIFHGLTTLGFYGYRFFSYFFFLCSGDINQCYEEKYFYEQLFEWRTYYGFGEGGITLLFSIIYIIALVKHLSCLSWMWIFKAFTVMGINVYYISKWMVRKDTLDIPKENKDVFNLFLMVNIGLTLAQLAITLAFCIITTIFCYVVARKRRERRRSLRNLHPRSPKFRNGNPTAPPLDGYDDSTSYLNQALTDSTNKLPCSPLP
ncbi:uncharacterized protein LOC123509008 [Portunus trituberculatus]|uniref:uncharacterized protein LOC123509008 n=1 Tax=Portunus trituberculatus TaxID=210409 RepID=UPI001E1CBB80|nr:uncharacterized protein LOC123509008 [Portunus trituberculatus]